MLRYSFISWHCTIWHAVSHNVCHFFRFVSIIFKVISLKVWLRFLLNVIFQISDYLASIIFGCKKCVFESVWLVALKMGLNSHCLLNKFFIVNCAFPVTSNTYSTKEIRSRQNGKFGLQRLHWMSRSADESFNNV